jgi:hypothetical protein
MEKINKIIVKYLVCAIPFHLILMAWSIWGGGIAMLKNNGAVKVITDILGWNIIVWLGVLIVVLIELLFNPDMQRRFFGAAARFAGVKERDERESLAIDRAGRYAYISTLCLLVVILFFCSLTVAAGNLPPDKWVDGKHKYLTIGFGFAFTDAKPKTEDPLRIFSSQDLQISRWSLIFIIIGWHVLSFMYFLRRTNKYREEK